MHDEKQALDYKVQEVARVDPDLVFIMQKYQWRRGHFDDGHMKMLRQIADTLGPKFTGILMPGIRAVELLASEEMDEGRGADSELDWNFDVGEDDREDGWEDDEDEEVEEEELAEMLETVLTLATDGVNLPSTDE
jgi:hypothetical protein